LGGKDDISKAPYCFRLVAYLDPGNHWPTRGPDEHDEWEYTKLKSLIEERPTWVSVETIILFKKPHFYDLIRENIHRITGEFEMFAYQHRCSEVYDDMHYPDLRWFKELILEKRQDLGELCVKLKNPDLTLLEALTTMDSE
jgi:hypothetical protein